MIFDVGANNGLFCLEVARKKPDIILHAFEPNSELYRHLCTIKNKENLSNLHIHKLAISDYTGSGKLNISDSADKGCSSLLDFNEINIKNDKYWRSRTDLKYSHTEEVSIITLSSFIKEERIDVIDFIKIDAQGLDLSILASSGIYLDIIKAGMLEVPSVASNSLYESESQDIHKALNFFSSNGYTIKAIKPNDMACNEFNIFFTKNPETWFDMINELGLVGIDIFDGKNYWHHHSRYMNYDESEVESRLNKRIINLNEEVERLNNRILELDKEILRLSRI
ncbi:FkbM family methyltransferase [Endozoicomonas gorgoniicola]|uniref:FkbM family methyltransferase n=1 Tax=Endozoicomonas gorgoniicola TaxID=1234144 RepID=A0ABT3MS44_9GAMM|nr:FkbM family methyltransferase [Endozoicomonas gorgoniicola]MCW7552195.1 FkbM family methyltransferase [Endozoicomonas gorgoniicola]